MAVRREFPAQIKPGFFRSAAPERWHGQKKSMNN
jgi:hypothetical protein